MIFSDPVKGVLTLYCVDEQDFGRLHESISIKVHCLKESYFMNT